MKSKRRIIKESMKKSVSNKTTDFIEDKLKISSDETVKELKAHTQYFSEMKDIDYLLLIATLKSNEDNLNFYSDMLKTQKETNEILTNSIENSKIQASLQSDKSVDLMDDSTSEPKITEIQDKKEDSMFGGFSGMFDGIKAGVGKLFNVLKIAGGVVASLVGVFEVFDTMFDDDKLKAFGDPSKMNWGEKFLAGVSSLVDFLSFGLINKNMVYSLVHSMATNMISFVSSTSDKFSEYLGKNDVTALLIKPLYDKTVKLVTNIGSFVGDTLNESLDWMKKLWNSDDKKGFLHDEMTKFIDYFSGWFSDKIDSIKNTLSGIVWDIKDWIYKNTGLDFFTNKDKEIKADKIKNKYKNINKDNSEDFDKDLKDSGIIKENFFNKKYHITNENVLNSLNLDQLKTLRKNKDLDYENKEKVSAVIKEKEKVLELNSKYGNKEKVSIVPKQFHRELPKYKSGDYSSDIERVSKPLVQHKEESKNINTSNNTTMNNSNTTVIQGGNGSHSEKQFMKGRL